MRIIAALCLLVVSTGCGSSLHRDDANVIVVFALCNDLRDPPWPDRPLWETKGARDSRWRQAKEPFAIALPKAMAVVDRGDVAYAVVPPGEHELTVTYGAQADAKADPASARFRFDLDATTQIVLGATLESDGRVSIVREHTAPYLPVRERLQKYLDSR